MIAIEDLKNIYLLLFFNRAIENAENENVFNEFSRFNNDKKLLYIKAPLNLCIVNVKIYKFHIFYYL